MTFKIHTQINRKAELERYLHAYGLEISNVKREIKRLQEAEVRMQIVYLGYEEEYSKLIADPLDNSALIESLKRGME